MKKAIQEKAWKDFADWCQSRNLRALPAHPWTVAFYARWCEGHHRHRTIVKAVKSISRVHLLHCHTPPDRHPVVARTLSILENRMHAKRQGSALFRAEDFLDGVAGGHPPSEAFPAPLAARLRLAKTVAPELEESSLDEVEEVDGEREEVQPRNAYGRRGLASSPKLVSRRPLETGV